MSNNQDLVERAESILSKMVTDRLSTPLRLLDKTVTLQIITEYLHLAGFNTTPTARGYVISFKGDIVGNADPKHKVMVDGICVYG